MKRLGVIILLVAGLGCGGNRKEVIPAQAGQVIPQAGIIVDADYDPRLDSLVPGYKLVTIAIDNNTLNPFRLDVKGDRWQVQDARGRWVRAIHDLKSRKQKVWRGLPSQIRQMVDYPEVIAVGETEVFDLFVQKSVALEGFRAIRFDSAAVGRVFAIQREP